MKANVYITLKSGLLDTQGRTIKDALESLGFLGVQDVRVGKYIQVEFKEDSAGSAEADIRQMCEKLLVNPVIESYRIELPQAR